MMRFLAALTVTTALMASLPVPLVAQAQRPVPPTAPGAPPQAGYVEPVQNAEELRERFQEVLSRYPRSVGRVLRLDPALFHDQAYLASYPALAQFVARYPEVARSPEFYLQDYALGNTGAGRDPRTLALDMFGNFLEGLMVFLAIALVAGAVLWLARALVDHRRWLRMSKIQTEVHTKLLDRFSSSEELLAYMKTPAGSRFLESAPIAVDPGASPRAVSAPLNRILWSVQAGVVLLLAGVGLIFMRHQAVVEEIRSMLYMMGVLATSIGLGFILSALASYGLSRRLGLLQGTGPGTAPSVSTTPLDSSGA
jgi:hypothetical protein